MKKVGIIAANNIRYSPYIDYYKRLLDKWKIDYELIYPDRHKFGAEWDDKYIRLDWSAKFPSLLNYYIFVNKVKKIIKRNNYSKLIVLTSQVAVFFASWIKKNYKNNYLVDIRDYSHEYNKLYFYFEKKAISNSACRVISSKKFEEFLPVADYHICHNINSGLIKEINRWDRRTGPIVIGYVGTLGYEDKVYKLIDLIKNDNRFCFYVYGGDEKEHPEIPSAVTFANCERIRFYGPYLPADKQKIIDGIDILFNVYGNESIMHRSALSNKLYDCMINHKLILNSENTYMEEMAGICGFSINLQTAKSLDDLFQWYNNIDEDDVISYQKRMLDMFIEENMSTESAIKEFIED